MANSPIAPVACSLICGMRYRAQSPASWRGTCFAAGACVLAFQSLPGCAGHSDWNPTDGLEPAPGVRDVSRRPAALVDGLPVSRSDLFPAAAELAGAQALREYALDRMLERELGDRGLEVTEAMLEAERDRLAGVTGQTELADPGSLASLLESRGLGPERLAALLRRNASLRLLIPETIISQESVDLAFRVRHGPRSVVRVAVFRTPTEASDALREIRSRARSVGLVAAFAEVAAARSIDPSAILGGLMGEISLLDPGLSASLRTAVRDAPIGEIGPMVALERAFALVLVEEERPGTGVEFAEVEAEISAEVRSRAERLAMDALAEDLITRAGITVLDPSLRWSWEQLPER